MNPPKVNGYDYPDFWLGTQQGYSCTESARVQQLLEDIKSTENIQRYLDLAALSIEAAEAGTMDSDK
jgi:hypothetical protein